MQGESKGSKREECIAAWETVPQDVGTKTEKKASTAITSSSFSSTALEKAMHATIDEVGLSAMSTLLACALTPKGTFCAGKFEGAYREG